MTPSEFSRRLAKIDESVLRELSIKAVHDNDQIVISDAIVSNAEGLTFAGNQISDHKPFTDWEETGEFHRNLKFENKDDIAFISKGGGAEAIFSTFPEDDTIAPTAKILSEEAKKDIKVSLIDKILNYE